MSRGTELMKIAWENMIKSKGFDRCLRNIKILSVGDGKCRAQFTVSEEHLNMYGFLHGGFTSTVIDCVSGYALVTARPDAKSGVSIDLHVTFLKSAFPGEVVTVDAKTIRHGKIMNFLAVELTKNDGKDVIARGQHTKYVRPPKTE